MRARLIGAAVLAAVAVVAAVILVGGGGGKEEERPSTGGAALATRTVRAGEVTIELEPRRVDATGAEFAVTLDTHSTELDMDLAAGARFAVGGVVWPVAGWEGDGPSGHHRAGTLRFRPGGPAQGPAVLRLDGFADPVEAEWALEPAP